MPSPLGIVTLKDLIDGVRGHLAQFPTRSSLAAGISASDTIVSISDPNAFEFIAQRALLEIDNEVLLVVSRDGGNCTVVRGLEGSTPAAHSSGAAVSIHEPWGWTDRTIRWNHLADAVRWLKPAAWIVGVSEPFIWTQGTFETQIPGSSFVAHPYGNAIINVEWQDSDGRYKPFYGWSIIGQYLRFREYARINRTLQIIYAHFQRPLTGLLECLDNDDFKEAIEFKAAALAMNALKTNRARFVEYSASLNDRASTPDELIRVAFDLTNQAVVSKENAQRPLPAGYLNTYRDPR